MGQNSASETEDGVLSANSPLSCNEGDSVGGISSCNSIVLKKGPWTSSEDAVLNDYVKKHGEGNWNAVKKHTGLARCGKSCRLRWANHLRPNLKKGAFTFEEERLIIELHGKMGNKWARIAANLPGRTDNEIKNYWNTRIKRRQRAGLPLYPPNLYVPAEAKIQQPLSSTSNSTRDFGHHDDISGSFSIYPETPEYGISSSHSRDNSFLSPNSYTIVQGSNELILDHENSDASARPPLFVSSRADTCPINTISQSFSMSFYKDTQFVSSIVPSASKHLIGAQRLELPSLQYQETSLGFFDLKSKSSYTIPENSGLLEDLIYGAKALGNSESHSVYPATLSNIKPGDVTDDSANKECLTGKSHYDPSSCVDENSFGSHRNDRTIPITPDNSLEDINMQSEIVKENWMLSDEMKFYMHNADYSMPDTLLEPCWSSLFTPENYCNDFFAAFLVNDNRSSISGRGSCSWNNMPGAFQIPETP